MPQFGDFALILGLALSAYTFLAGAVALRQAALGYNADRLAETARRAGIAVWICVVGASYALVYCALTNDFSVAYILHHSNRDLPTPYKFATLWSGQEGSLLFWALLLSTYGLVLRARHKVDTKLVAYASAILACIQSFFLLLLYFAANPFALTPGRPPADGAGLNALLQYTEMVIHPPMLYLGYVGFSVPFAFALGALMMRYPGEKWIHITRRWTMVAWIFLTCGVFLGAHWAYSVLGWGGYWGWDPVENASLLPWLTGTAFLHSVMMQEKRGMLKSWNVWLIFTTFMLSILGTFLTRSGVISSVHAFAQSSIGNWFLWFLGFTFAVCLFTYLKNIDHLKSDHKLESLVSRESSFLFQNWVLLASCFAVLWGTLFPILSEWVQGHKVTVGPPFFNRVNIPIGMFLILLTGVGPMLAWRSTSFQSIRRNFAVPTILGVLTAIAMIAGGANPWQDQSRLYSVMAISLSVFVVGCVSSEFIRGGRVIARKNGVGLLPAMVHLTTRNTRRYGGYIIHFGFVVVAIGLAGVAFNQEKEMELGFGQSMDLGGYKLVCQSYSQNDNPNYSTEFAILDVYKNGNFITQLTPEKRFYKASQQPNTIVALRSTIREDLYVIYAGRNNDTDKPIIKAFVNPLVSWIWFGWLVMVAGTGIALWPGITAEKAALKRVVAPVREAVPLEPEPVEVEGD